MSEKKEGVGKVTAEINTGYHSDVAFGSFDAGSSCCCEADRTERWIVHPLIWECELGSLDHGETGLSYPTVLLHCYSCSVREEPQVRTCGVGAWLRSQWGEAPICGLMAELLQVRIPPRGDDTIMPGLYGGSRITEPTGGPAGDRIRTSGP